MAVTITIDDVKKARNYMPIENKYALTGFMAKLIVRITENDAGSKSAPLPPMRIEDRIRRAQFLNGVLAGYYFGAQFDREKLLFRDEETGETKSREIELCMSVSALDDWLSGHPINQLERLKKDKSVANKVYDILYDFRAFELMLNSAIREEMDKANDPAIRMAEVLAAQTTPESLKETMDLLKEYREKIGEGENA